jgi:hypothetical protein
MPEDIKVPGLGEVDKKYVIAGVLTGVGVGVIVYIRSRNKAAQAAATPATTGTGMTTDPAGNQCEALDPNSGYCPGSPEDVAYQENSSGSLSGLGYGGDIGYAGTGVSEAGLLVDPAGNQCQTLDPSTGYCPGTPEDQAAQASLTGSQSATGTVSSAITTNSQWVTAALAVLPGGNTGANQTALASVLGGVAVTTAQKNVFMEAVALVGQPPQGYPPINTTDTSGQPYGGGSSGQGSTSGSGSTGSGAGAAKAGAISNLRIGGYNETGVTFNWNRAQGDVGGYAWKLTSVSGQGITQSGNLASGTTQHSCTGLKAGIYNYGIQALPGGPGNNIHTPALKG